MSMIYVQSRASRKLFWVIAGATVVAMFSIRFGVSGVTSSRADSTQLGSSGRAETGGSSETQLSGHSPSHAHAGSSTAGSLKKSSDAPASGESQQHGSPVRSNSPTDAVQAEEDQPSPVAPLYPNEVAQKIGEFFKKLLSKESLTPEQQQLFSKQLLATLENSVEAREQVKLALQNTPLESTMERDILRQMLGTSQEGRDIIKSEVMATWESKNTARYPEMYETLFQTTRSIDRDLLDNAFKQLSATADRRSAVASLNYIGLTEYNTSSDAMHLRQSTIQSLAQFEKSTNDDLVRALAVQKMYRLAGPDAATKIAETYLNARPYPDLIKETINSIRSRDITLTDSLKKTLQVANSKIPTKGG